MAFHQRNETSGDTWLTPPEILAPLGQFDLDPCAAPEPRPWGTAQNYYIEEDDGLTREWFGRVWLNPPYGRTIGAWLKKMAAHVESGGSGIALIFARTDTRAWQDHVFPAADSVLWVRGRLKFCLPDGTVGAAPAGAPSALVAYTPEDTKVLADSGIPGVHTKLRL